MHATSTRYLPAFLITLFCSTAMTATAACLTDHDIAQLISAYETGTPAATPTGLTPAGGACTRARLNEALQAKLGPAVGYKAGLTNPAVQQRFKHDAPVRGTLYAPMLLPEGATVDANFGARPLFEADLLVRVSDASINRANSPADVLAATDQLIPFIELPDLLVADPGALNGAAIMAINVGARLGVTGTPLAVENNAAFSNMLRDMQVVVRSGDQELDRGKGSDVLGHPLSAVIWLVRDLARDGLALKPGDLVSLGSFSGLHAPSPGTTITVEYLGLPGNPQVSVNFRQAASHETPPL